MANLEQIVEELSSLTVLEAADLSKLLEEKWGVSAAAQVAVAAPGAGEAARTPRHSATDSSGTGCRGPEVPLCQGLSGS